jgi:outer membrane receptor protein involved in Fe transport
MENYPKRLALISGGCLAFLMGSAPSQLIAAEASSDSLDEVIVVAQRKEERALTVPLSVIAINEEALQANVIQSGLDLLNMVPSLSVLQGSLGYC